MPYTPFPGGMWRPSILHELSPEPPGLHRKTRAVERSRRRFEGASGRTGVGEVKTSAGAAESCFREEKPDGSHEPMYRA